MTEKESSGNGFTCPTCGRDVELNDLSIINTHADGKWSVCPASGGDARHVLAMIKRAISAERSALLGIIEARAKTYSSMAQEHEKQTGRYAPDIYTGKITELWAIIDEIKKRSGEKR